MICPHCGEPFLPKLSASLLTDAEKSTLRIFLSGTFRYKEIAHQMGTVEQVVKNRMHSIFKKLEISRTELARYSPGEIDYLVERKPKP